MIWEFEYNNGYSGVVTVSSDLLDTEERARQRAIAEFVNGGTKQRRIEFRTYRTDLRVGDIVRIDGAAYRVSSVVLKVSDKSMIATVQGVSYV